MKSLLQIIRYISRHPLAGKHKVKAIMLLFRWQLSQRLLPFAVEYPFVGKTKLLIKKGLTGATGNIYTGLHEFTDMGFLLHFLRSNDLFADIGANVGSYTILAAGYIGAKTISVEPVPQTFEWLRKNVTINGADNLVKIINCGIGSAEGKLFFTKDYDTVNHVVKDPATYKYDTVEVSMNSLDKLLGEEIPSLIKVDVEGFEQEVVNGAEKLLSNERLKAIIIELNGSGGRYGYNEEDIHHQLIGYGFKPFSYDPFTRKLDELTKFGKLNTVYIRDLDFVKHRVQTAPFVELFSEKF